MAGAIFVPINGATVRWAREEVGLSQSALARRLQVSVADVAGWEEGFAQPNKTQFQALAGAVHRPTALLLGDPPSVSSPLKASFRRTSEQTPLDYAHEAKQLQSARAYQETLEWLVSEMRPAWRVPLETLHEAKNDTSSAADRFRTQLQVSWSEQLAFKDYHAALRSWRLAVEKLGIYVFQMTFQDGSKACRGFSLASETAPVIVLNSSFLPQARIFTLMHEVAHLLLRDSAICMNWVRRDTKDANERWAEQFAAELLLPKNAFLGLLTQKSPSGDVDRKIVQTIASETRISQRAVAIRLIELGRAPWDLYEEIVRLTANVDSAPKSKSDSSGGERLPLKRLRELGSRYAATVLSARDEQLIGDYDLLRYLDTDSRSLTEIRLGLSPEASDPLQLGRGPQSLDRSSRGWGTE